MAWNEQPQHEVNARHQRLRAVLAGRVAARGELIPKQIDQLRPLRAVAHRGLPCVLHGAGRVGLAHVRHGGDDVASRLHEGRERESLRSAASDSLCR
jgi:hypothetical protein